MMYKKLLFLSSVFLFAACGTTETDEPPADEETINEEANASEEEVVDDTSSNKRIESDYLLTNLINEETFADPYALEAWADYQQVVQQATYGEITLLNEETVDFAQLDGFSKEEIDQILQENSLRDDVFLETAQVSDTEFLDYYRYPAEADSSFSEVSDFLAELAFYYVDDNLMFSSITPGYYLLETDNLPDATTLMSYTTLEEIETLNPKIYTIGEMKINGNVIRQVMTPAMAVNEEGTEELVAFYLFIHDETILQYAYLPFEMVMQSFPDYSVMVYQQLIPVIAELDI